MIVETKVTKNRHHGGTTIFVKNGSGLRATLQAQIEVYNDKSSFGINGGRISKLFVAENEGWGNYLYVYDRQIVEKSTDDKVMAFVNEIIRKYN